MQGQETPMPGQFGAEIAVMQEMAWSWPDLMAAPLDLVGEILERVRARSHWQRIKQKAGRGEGTEQTTAWLS